jgi:hypothetical protein
MRAGRLEIAAGVSKAGRLPACAGLPRILRKKLNPVSLKFAGIDSSGCIPLCSRAAATGYRSRLDRFHVAIDAHKVHKLPQYTTRNPSAKTRAKIVKFRSGTSLPEPRLASETTIVSQATYHYPSNWGKQRALNIQTYAEDVASKKNEGS